MNPEQVKSGVRWLVSAFGAVIAGFIAGKGWVSADKVMSVLSSEVFMSIAVSIAMGVWGLFVHKQSNAIAVVDAIPAVKGVVTKPTQEGRELTEAVASPTVAPAGSSKAQEIARPTTGL